MSSNKPLRARRGRMLLVGHAPELAHLTRQLRPASGDSTNGPIVVPNLFDALGEVTIATSSSPIATMIVHEELLDPANARAIEAMRKIDPALRVVLLSKTSAGEQWSNRGFDDCITSPASPADLARLFDDDALMIGAHNGQGNGAAPSEHSESNGAPKPAGRPAAISLDELRSKLASTTPTTLRIELESEENSEEDAAEELQVRQDRQPVHAAETSAAQSPQVAPAPEKIAHMPSAAAPPEPQQPTQTLISHTLGDSDLVDAVMTATGNVCNLALHIIAQQTGWRGVRVIAPEHSIPNRDLQVEIAWEGRRFGWLQADAVRAEQLHAWGPWLSRWLALEETYRECRVQALQDDLTGAWNRRFFDTFLAQSINQAGKLRRPVTVMVFDLDNFKSFNDEFGHEAGDEILRETVKLLTSVIRQGDRVCRIGGDEFAVIFADPEAPRLPGSTHPESVDIIAHRFQDQICKMRFPKLAEQAPGTISISAGLATFPWDGHDPQTLLRRADQLALESKRKGKNAITLGPGTTEFCRRNP